MANSNGTKKLTTNQKRALDQVVARHTPTTATHVSRALDIPVLQAQTLLTALATAGMVETLKSGSVRLTEAGLNYTA